MLHSKSGPLIRPMCSLFRDRFEVKDGFGIPTTEGFNNEGNKNDTLTTALFKMLSVFATGYPLAITPYVIESVGSCAV